MSVVLVFYHDSYNGPAEPIGDRIAAAVLPNRKVISKTQDPDDGIVETIGDYPNRWKENKKLRDDLVSSYNSFYEFAYENEEKNPELEDLSPPDPNEEEMPLSALYMMILKRFDNQSITSAIFTNEDAKKHLQEAGWFNG